MWKVLSLVLLGLLAFGCMSSGFSRQSPEDYAETRPKFELAEALGGKLVAQGVIFGPTGKVSERFVADMEGEWSGNKGQLREYFTYSNGTKQTRIWTLEVDDAGNVRGTAPDVIGEAKGQISGATMRLEYKLKLTEAAGGHVLDVTDWIYLTDDGTIINRAEMRKFGFKVAELFVTFRKVDAQ